MPNTDVAELTDLDPHFVRDPYPAYAALRARGPVHLVRTPEGDELYLVVGYEAARAAYTDPRLSRDWRRYQHLLEGELPIFAATPGHEHMLQRDPPDHNRLRRLVAREFTPRRIAALAPYVREVTDGLLDAMADGAVGGERGADLIDALAFPLPMTVICELLGVPDLDRRLFRGWSNEVVAPTSQVKELAAYEAMIPYLVSLVQDKHKVPGPDLLSALITTVDENGDRLDEDELLSMAFLLLVAGHETTVNLIGNGMRALFAHPEQLAALRADLDGLLDGAVEEMLRYDGPVEGSTPRLAIEPLDLGGGTVIPAGSEVVIVMADADRDPARFPEPDRFDIRRDARGHIAFGHGIHYCLGAPLARLEGRTAVRRLLERFPRLEQEPDETPGWLPGLLMRGTRRLPVRW
ncbi:cytochrome P450 [Streptomyces sp. NPDC048172]|uniref:cytochrome P450 family protein n=1 Tax=Streptomyces sp. NPDC048172 TaxID=3365505 RepID=UPI00372306B7